MSLILELFLHFKGSLIFSLASMVCSFNHIIVVNVHAVYIPDVFPLQVLFKKTR